MTQSFYFWGVCNPGAHDFLWLDFLHLCIYSHSHAREYPENPLFSSLPPYATVALLLSAFRANYFLHDRDLSFSSQSLVCNEILVTYSLITVYHLLVMRTSNPAEPKIVTMESTKSPIGTLLMMITGTTQLSHVSSTTCVFFPLGTQCHRDNDTPFLLMLQLYLQKIIPVLYQTTVST